MSKEALKAPTKSDLLNDTYRITQPIRELSNEFCEYYEAEAGSDSFYCIVYNKFYTYPPNFFEYFIENPHPNFINPIACGLVKLTNIEETRFAVIINKYDYKNNLENYIKENGACSLKFLIEKLIIPFCNLLEIFNKQGFSAGNINLKNIIFENNIFKLRENYISPPHSQQTNAFLSLEIIDCIPYGRETNNISADLFALGLCIFFAYMNISPWEKYNAENLKNLRFARGSFTILTGKYKVNEEIKALIRGLINDNVVERWKLKSIFHWLKGEEVKVYDNNAETIVPINFNNNNYYGFKAFASALGNNWEQAVSLIKEDKILAWLSRNNISSNIIEQVSELLPVDHMLAKALTEEKLFKLIAIFDATGPLRFKGLSITIGSIPFLLNYYNMQNQQESIAIIIQIITKHYYKYFIEFHSNFVDKTGIVSRLSLVAELYRPNISTFSIERIMYLLNPDLPCQSPLVKQYYILNLESLFKALEEYSINNPVGDLIIDKHIIAFIANYLKIKYEIKIKNLVDFPHIANNPLIASLSILVLSYQHINKISIKNLCIKYHKSLTKILEENIHNRNFKIKMKEQLEKATANENLAEILNIITNNKIYKEDLKGYKNALKQINYIDNKIVAVANLKRVKDTSYDFGLKITALISYILCILISFLMVA